MGKERIYWNWDQRLLRATLTSSRYTYSFKIYRQSNTFSGARNQKQLYSKATANNIDALMYTAIRIFLLIYSNSTTFSSENQPIHKHKQDFSNRTLKPITFKHTLWTEYYFASIYVFFPLKKESCTFKPNIGSFFVNHDCVL